MIVKVNKIRDHFNFVSHAALVSGTCFASLLIGKPWTTIAGLIVAMGCGILVTKGAKALYENLKPHSKSHSHAPNLNEIADELYLKSGLNEEKNPIYSMELKPASSFKGKTPPWLKEIFVDILALIEKTPNAFAFRQEQSVIAISTPLLKLLDSEEEKAVLAHEFVHAAADHGRKSSSLVFLKILSNTSNCFLRLGAMFNTGLQILMTYIVTKLFFKQCIVFSNPDGYLLNQDKNHLNLNEIIKRKRVERQLYFLNNVFALSLFGAADPAFLHIYWQTRALDILCRFVSANLSRRNEFQADREAISLGANPLALITSLRKIEYIHEKSMVAGWVDQHNLKRGRLTSAWRQLFSSHPRTEDRIKQLSQIARSQGQSEDNIREACTRKMETSSSDIIPAATLCKLFF